MKKTRKKKKTSKKSFNLKYIIYILLLIIFSLSAFIIGIIYTQKNYEKELKKTQNSIKILQEKIKKLKKSSQKQEKKETYSSVPSEIMDYKKSHNTTIILPPKTKEKPAFIPLSKKPKLVIIIDDVSFKGQVKKIKKIPYKITPSFFPPTNRHPNTAVYAKEFSHYMVHLPMQAIHFKKPEPKTLNINDSYLTILSRIDEIKKMFPKAKFINNHTGSTFTSNKEAMIKLFRALKTENMGFVDSKTTPNSKAKEAQKEFYIPLYSRNIFLDNEENPTYIRNQLKKAVKIAQKRGYAIAIGHPHSITLETLKNSTDILKNIDVVYIDELSKNK
ncbi:putative periplasmic protein [Nautilia profundicola AmH]|uniref:Periplasmic protein n=1 Tax=Nautilia profundicola (strain ATCC BAA-1463 / DSM 18972 / AmH) TaxID=598659 RepID=B9LA91_NAUPA|nr:divergent polysaccharide deacetylase family protein [Nautilia profundicola]ACM92486.1 putative periplasmic protein [Nautilia profundicola AmH]